MKLGYLLRMFEHNKRKYKKSLDSFTAIYAKDFAVATKLTISKK